MLIQVALHLRTNLVRFLRLNYPKNYHLNYIAPNRNLHNSAHSWVVKRDSRPDGCFLSGHINGLVKFKGTDRTAPPNTQQDSNLKASIVKSVPAQPMNCDMRGKKEKEPVKENGPDSRSLPLHSDKSSLVQPTELFCPRCLGPSHSWKACVNPIRCNYCYNYGHKSLYCLRKARQSRLTWAVKRSEGEGSGERNKFASPTPAMTFRLHPLTHPPTSEPQPHQARRHPWRTLPLTRALTSPKASPQWTSRFVLRCVRTCMSPAATHWPMKTWPSSSQRLQSTRMISDLSPPNYVTSSLRHIVLMFLRFSHAHLEMHMSGSAAFLKEKGSWPCFYLWIICNDYS